MKMIWREILVCLLMGMVLPGTMVNMAKNYVLQPGPQPEEENLESRATEQPLSGNLSIPVRFPDGTVRQMDLEEYLVGVVLAEMPASFEGEALKAQAVAARTYTAKANATGGKHGDGSLCVDPGCCQAYVSEGEYLRSGGTDLGIRKVRGAVKATLGQVLIHGGELIEATYFSCSGGTTEDAQAVWGSEFPYLKAVESPGEENAEFYSDRVIIPREKAEMLLGLTLPEDPSKWLGHLEKTPGDGIATLEIGGRIFKGTELRTLLGLKSTRIIPSADDRGLILETRGWGHRVGMSQYGADAMAASGKTYREILSHYYTGTEIVSWPIQSQAQVPEFTEDSQSPVA